LSCEGAGGFPPPYPPPQSPTAGAGTAGAEPVAVSPSVSTPDRRKRAPNFVTLNLYHLSPWNECLGSMGIGMYHAGVEVFGFEVSYGGRDSDDTGVGWSLPKEMTGVGTECYTPFFQSVPVGETKLSKEEVVLLVKELQQAYRANEYDVLYWNCHHFVDEFARALVPGFVTPKWISRIGKLGQGWNCMFGCWKCCHCWPENYEICEERNSRSAEAPGRGRTISATETQTRPRRRSVTTTQPKKSASSTTTGENAPGPPIELTQPRPQEANFRPVPIVLADSTATPGDKQTTGYGHSVARGPPVAALTAGGNLGPSEHHQQPAGAHVHAGPQAPPNANRMAAPQQAPPNANRMAAPQQVPQNARSPNRRRPPARQLKPAGGPPPRRNPAAARPRGNLVVRKPCQPRPARTYTVVTTTVVSTPQPNYGVPVPQQPRVRHRRQESGQQAWTRGVADSLDGAVSAPAVQNSIIYM